MGLAICKDLVKLMGSELSVASVLGQGSTFTFTAQFQKGAADPRSADHENHAPVPPRSVPHSTLPIATFRRGRILLVEDNPVNQLLTMQMIRKLGFDVDLAPDGIAATRLTEDHAYDLIFMDCHMPVMDGYQATSFIRKSPRHRNAKVPIVALTALSSEENQGRCIRAGMTDYLSKPLKLQDLALAIAKWIPENQMSPPQTFEVSQMAQPQEAALNSEPKDLPEKTLNFNLLTRLCAQFPQAGPSDLVDELFRAFFTFTPQRIELLQQAFRDRDFAALERLAHTLRSACVTVGADRMAKICSRIETAPTTAFLESLATELEEIRNQLILFRKQP